MAKPQQQRWGEDKGAHWLSVLDFRCVSDRATTGPVVACDNPSHGGSSYNILCTIEKLKLEFRMDPFFSFGNCMAGTYH